MLDTFQALKEQGICPTCYHYKLGNLQADIENRKLYEDDILFCFFADDPRSVGHTIILLKNHYEDMSFVSDDLCAYVFTFAKKVMNILKDVLAVEKVYLCTMCDGKPNHFHVQLIPRHPDAEIGSTNFIKARMSYIKNEVVLQSMREKLSGPA